MRKSIALKTLSSKPSKDDQSDCEERDDKNSDDDAFRLFVKKCQRYIRKNQVKHSERNLAKFRKKSKSSKYDENRKGKFLEALIIIMVKLVTIDQNVP